MERLFARRAAYLLAIAAALIVYASLFPWEFHPRNHLESPLWTLLHSWPVRIDRFAVRDAFINVAGYAPLGIFAFLAIAPLCGTPLGVSLAVLLGLALSSTMEMLQLYDGTRECSALDVVCNTAGAAAGALAASVHRGVLARTAARPGVRALLRPSAALFLVLCWAGFLVVPPLPVLSRTRLAARLATLADTPISLVATFTALVDWLIAAQMLEALVGRKRIGTALPLLLLLTPVRLVVVDRKLTLSDCAGAAGAWLVWMLLQHSQPKRALLLACLSIASLIVYGLAPFHFRGEPGTFTWVPFGATLMSERDSAAAVLLRKCLRYGGTLQLLRMAEFPYGLGTAAVALLLAIIEAVQLYLPGHAAEITDPLLAVVLAVVLRQLDSRRRGPPPVSSRRA